MAAPPKPEQVHSELVGCWRYNNGAGPQEYQILRTEDGRLQFWEPRQSSNMVITGILKPSGGWLQAALFVGEKGIEARYGDIRFSLVSNLRMNGVAKWGNDVVARKVKHIADPWFGKRSVNCKDASTDTSEEQKEEAKLAGEEQVTEPGEFKKDVDVFSLASLHSRVEILMSRRVSDDLLLFQAFSSLVETLSQGGELERRTDQWQESAAFAGAAGTRSALSERQACLCRVEEPALQAEILARDEARAAHVEGLQQALGAILLATACASVDELDEAISAETAFVARRVVALSTARSVAIMHPGIGGDAPPDRGADGEVDVTVKAAAERYDQYLKAYASRRDAMASATNSAVKAVRGELLSTPLFEEGDGSEAQGSAVPSINTDAKALDTVNKYISTACIAADEELAFWDSKPHEVTLPSTQLLNAGTKQLDMGIQRLEVLRRARRTYAVLSAELAEEEQALATEKHRDPALRDMNLVFSEHLDATFALEDAERHVERSRRRGLPASSADDAAIQAAKESAKKSQMKLHAAMHKVIQLMTWYPEAARDKVVSQHLHISMPADLLPLWRAERTVGHFDTCERVAMSKHAVYKVIEGDRAYALKEYNLVGGEDALRRSLREAAFLVRARHPNIASIEAVFTDASRNSMYLQMPFYKHGSLDQWVKEEQPDDLSIRRSLAHVATAIAHLHGLGIVHADVKPPNIFINEHGMAHLGDFDISVDGSTRTSVSYLQTTMMQVGFTIGFAAPELFKSGASFATDVFAFGATLSSVAHPSPERDALAAELQASEPSSRPEIKTVLGSSFFAPTFTWVREQRRRCSICLEDGIALEEGLECSGEGLHFLCGACLKQYTEVQCQETMRARQAAEGRVLCPSPGCHTPYCDSDLARRLDAATFLKYNDARMDLVEQRRSQELEEAMEKRLAAELQRLRALDEEQRELLAVRKHIEEDILTLKCPRCGQAFIDFEGCFALRCSRCPCGFCAWCGEDSGGNDAHAHVRQCRAKPRGADVFFGARQQFDEAQQRRRRARLLEYLPTLNARVRSAVLRELRPRLEEFGLGDVLRQAG